MSRRSNKKDFGDKITLRWEGWVENSPAVLLKAEKSFQSDNDSFHGSRRHCAKEVVHWLWQKKFFSIDDLIDWTLYWDPREQHDILVEWAEFRKSKRLTTHPPI